MSHVTMVPGFLLYSLLYRKPVAKTQQGCEQQAASSQRTPPFMGALPFPPSPTSSIDHTTPDSFRGVYFPVRREAGTSSSAC